MKTTTAVAAVAFALAAHGAALTRRQCAATLSDAAAIAKELQSKYFNSGTGQYNDGELWTDANTIEDLHNLMLAAGTDEYGSLADNTYIGQAANDPGINWESILDGSNDDAQWIILALWKVADYKSSKGQDASAYNNAAANIYDIIAGQWDDTCGGGVWWSTAHTYKNSVTNELFLLTSAEGYNRSKNQTYLDNANKEANWLLASGLRGSNGLFNDGLDMSTCKNNGQTTWTYNQAVVASGLGALAVATGNSSWLDEAEISLDATISSLTQDNILKESCDDAASGGATCNRDQSIFKGIWTKHLQYYLDSANDASRTSKYSGFLGSQLSAVTHYGENANQDIGSVWYAPNAGGSQFNPQASASGLEAVISAAKYGPC